MNSRRLLDAAANFPQTHLNAFHASKKPGRLRTILVFFATLVSLAGCLHSPAPYRPRDWPSKTLDFQFVREDIDRPRLQVIIVYGPLWCHHSALRLTASAGRVLFWDPGGGYGVADSIETRNKDVILLNPPDLERYLHFAWEHSSQEVEVFEWDLMASEADGLYELLSPGAAETNRAARFNTRTMGGLCAVALSDFLKRFAPARMSVPGKFFLPHNLARVLYTRSPKRILVFRRGEIKVVEPP